ncbi:class-II aminoacyl-tRNA synthetase family protein [Streptomyces triticagri]|uniref:hypothetical protein n=1 Tax=Streptomyces triticagri TaxID=2293568 RepID=UPI0018F63D19|nr:hypothetical protein [Streptomyces triticagri]
MSTVAQPTDAGLGVLASDELRLIRVFESLVLTWAERLNAQERRYPFLLQPEDLDSIDYYDNFPHLGLAATAADPARLEKARTQSAGPTAALPASVLNDARLALPSAACYAVYFDLRGRTLESDGALFTTVATCFRNEDRYEGLRRLLGFSMREIVFVGKAEGAKAHLTQAKELVLGLAARLGLDASTEVATDPFFDRNGSRATMQKLFPVKEEFVVDGLAIGSVNYHRNFFGDRCGIRVPSGEQAHTSCLAFGLERWVHVLVNRFGDADTAAEALLEVGLEGSDGP